ncbi:ornithine-acyl-ACP acyltransferase [Meridianimarinicoccus roseus]|jgi:putative hemolysin|uniref:L-ornithine N(alpha)-acyltransferase n=1 Tax=Meridianimarinicoccus roseus TaxID=2072018 RepID=A0A2V2LEN0_9RHOB|nr:GNAT family N-acyltransferase [Meridianimarinicoccus roseus]PWR04048.1 ornithine-acyl-ACP acyltransferase [Meridianimarinicoccus roseus]
MNPHQDLIVRLARDERDLLAAQRLRYEVFVEELGGDGALVDHEGRFERDAYDPFYDHMLAIDPARDDGHSLTHVIGVYRLMRGENAARAGGFYTAGEYDLAPLLRSGRRLLELGRSCLKAEYRGGKAMWHLWNGLAAYTLQHEIEVLFGVASFHGTDPAPLAAPLSLLHHRYLAPEDIRVRAVPEHFLPLDLMAAGDIDAAAGMRAMPSLIKAYLRLGGFIGEGAFVDREFNTIDVCLLLDTARMNDRQRQIYTRGLPA